MLRAWKRLLVLSRQTHGWAASPQLAKQVCASDGQGAPYEKAWADLHEGQKIAAARLGAAGAEEWDNFTAKVWRLAWVDLSVDQQAAAYELGLNEATWADVVVEEEASIQGLGLVEGFSEMWFH